MGRKSGCSCEVLPGLSWRRRGQHERSRRPLSGVRRRFDPSGRPRTTNQRCRTEYQRAEPLDWENNDLLALTAFVARQSRGQPIAVSSGQELRAFVDHGRRLFEQREGQLNLSCSQCHDDNWGERVAGNIIPQGHPTGYPIYRLEWQSLGSLQRRLRNCIVGMRAEPYEFGSAEYVALETFLMQRAAGLKIETPGVRP